MAEGDKAECHTVQRQGEFTLKLQSNIREVREESTSTKSTKYCLYSSGITEIFFSKVTPQLLPLSLCRKSDLSTDLDTMKSDFLLKQGLEETKVTPLNHSDQVDG